MLYGMDAVACDALLQFLVKRDTRSFHRAIRFSKNLQKCDTATTLLSLDFGKVFLFGIWPFEWTKRLLDRRNTTKIWAHVGRYWRRTDLNKKNCRFPVWNQRKTRQAVDDRSFPGDGLGFPVRNLAVKAREMQKTPTRASPPHDEGRGRRESSITPAKRRLRNRNTDTPRYRDHHTEIPCYYSDEDDDDDDIG